MNKTNSKVKPVTLTDKEKEDLLYELFEKDHATVKVSLSDKAPTITLRTVSYEDQKNLETILKSISNSEKSGRLVLQEYAVNLIARTIVSWGDITFPSVEKALAFLNKKSVAMIDKLVKEQQLLERKVKVALGTQTIEETLFPKEELLEESEPLPEESTQENGEVSEKQ